MTDARGGESKTSGATRESERPAAAANDNKPYIESWDEYFLVVAAAVARKSKDPRCQVGAVIASPDHVLLSSGFNGLARGVFDDPILLAAVDEKLKWICHAEVNAILNGARVGTPLKGCTIFVTKFPCLACCNAIVQSGLRRVYTHDTKFWDDDGQDADHSRKTRLIKQTGLEIDAPYHPFFQPKLRVG